MTIVFYIAAAVAVLTTLLAITRVNAVHALLYMITSLFSVGVVFYTLGAPFVAALEVIIYAGAIMVLFVFAIMMLNPGSRMMEEQKAWTSIESWAGPAFFAFVLLAEVIYLIVAPGPGTLTETPVEPHAVGKTLYTTYLLGVELASMLLLAGVIGANHLGHHTRSDEQGVM